MSAQPSHADRLAAIMAKTSTTELIKSLRAIEKLDSGATTEETRLMRSWIIDELLTRHPSAAAAVTAAFDVDVDAPYVDILIADILKPARAAA
jgi:hypothetical protein